MATFTWTADFNATRSVRTNVRKIQFGDGYQQRVPEGMNAIAYDWNLRFSNRTVDEIDEIDTFLKARGGYEAFEWTPQREATARIFICEKWERSPTYGATDTLTAIFSEVFEP